MSNDTSVSDAGAVTSNRRQPSLFPFALLVPRLPGSPPLSFAGSYQSSALLRCGSFLVRYWLDCMTRSQQHAGIIEQRGLRVTRQRRLLPRQRWGCSAPFLPSRCQRGVTPFAWTTVVCCAVLQLYRKVPTYSSWLKSPSLLFPSFCRT